MTVPLVELCVRCQSDRIVQRGLEASSRTQLLCAADETSRDLVAGANRFSIIVDDHRQLSMNVRMQPLVDPTRLLSAFRREAAKTAESRFDFKALLNCCVRSIPLLLAARPIAPPWQLRSGR